MRIVFFGSAEFGVPCLEAIVRSRHELAGLFTQPARPAGRRREPKPTEVALWARQKKINCLEAENINAPLSAQQAAACRGELLVVIAFGQKISRDVIGLFPKGAINVHASLLPKYRGAGPIFWALMNGETRTGISIITLADRMDAGDILAQAQTQITPEDTAQTLHDRLAALSAPILMQTIDAIEAGTATYTPQDESQVTWAPKLRKEHGYIDWARPADHVVNQIRALWPWPGAQAVYVSGKTGRSCRVIIKKARRIECSDQNRPTSGLLNMNLDVWCGRDALRIEELKPAGSGLMSFNAFVNGRACQPGDLFLPLDQVLKGVFE
jgi:methionyl-tRNA formyltransferase